MTGFLERKQLIINGKNVLVAGIGKPLIFLHGFMSSKQAFARQIDYFARNYTVYAVDLTGFGDNPKMDYPYRLDDYVDEFFALVDYIGERVSVIAHSFGCRIALKAAACSDKIEKMVLCGVAGLKPPFSLKRETKRLLYRLLRKVIGKERSERMFCSPDYLMTTGNMRESFKLITREYLDDKLSKINCPVLCIFGEKDRETPCKLIKRLKVGIKGCEMVVMKGCGHFCFVEKPAEFNMIVAEFLL